MHHPVRLALLAVMLLAGTADARPGRKHGKAKDESSLATFERIATAARAEVEEETEEPVVERDEPEEEPVRVHKRGAAPAKQWHVALGPNLWASSVDAKVTVGTKTISTGIGFLDLQHHARYGIPLLGEVHYGRFFGMVDFMYGVIDVAGGKDVGPLMVTVDGSASSLNVDAFGGVRLVGDDQSRFAVDALGGLRYARTAISATAMLDAAPVTTYDTVSASRDAVAGGRVMFRPFGRFAVAGTFDFGLFGTSSRTWSAAADASLGITSHVLVSLGWRTLTSEGAMVNLTMRGPRAAIQLLF